MDCLQALSHSTQNDTIDDLFKDLYGHSRTWAQIRVAQDMHSAGLERWSLQTLGWIDNRFQSKVEYATYAAVPDCSGAVCCLSLTTYDLRILPDCIKSHDDSQSILVYGFNGNLVNGNAKDPNCLCVRNVSSKLWQVRLDRPRLKWGMLRRKCFQLNLARSTRGGDQSCNTPSNSCW